VQVFLETPRLIIRRFTEADAESMFAMDQDPDVMRFIGLYGLPDVEAYRTRIRDGYIVDYVANNGYGFWVAAEKDGAPFIGWFHLRPAMQYRFAVEAGYQPGEFDLGYRFVKSATRPKGREHSWRNCSRRRMFKVSLRRHWLRIARRSV